MVNHYHRLPQIHRACSGHLLDSLWAGHPVKLHAGPVEEGLQNLLDLLVAEQGPLEVGDEAEALPR